MKLIYLSAIWYFIGMLCFYHMADWSKFWWGEAYYIWDKAKDVLFASVIAFEIPKIGKHFKIIFYFCIIRLIWEIVAATINSNINNSKVIDWIFVLFLVIWVFQYLKEWLKSR